jgi:hypothetical protein
VLMQHGVSTARRGSSKTESLPFSIFPFHFSWRFPFHSILIGTPKRLEIAVTLRKQSSRVSSNRYKITVSIADLIGGFTY